MLRLSGGGEVHFEEKLEKFFCHSWTLYKSHKLTSIRCHKNYMATEELFVNAHDQCF
jgi:hypothetical protein